MTTNTISRRISILAVFYCISGIALIGHHFFLGRQFIQGIESNGGSSFLEFFFVLLTGIWAIIAGIGVWRKKQWGWWIGTLYLFHAIFRNINYLLFIPTLIARYGLPDLGINYYYIKHGASIFMHFLLVIYIFTPQVSQYFHIEKPSTIKRVIITASGAVCILFIFLFSSAFFNQNELKNTSILYSQGKIEMAYSRILAYLQHHPNNDSAWTVKGKILYSMKDYLEAKEAYKKALELNPENFQALYTLGKFAREEGDNETAMNYYQQAIEINPHYARIYTGMTIIEFERGHSQKALEYALKGYQYDKKEPIIAANLALAYHRNGLIEERDEMTAIAKKLGYDGIENLEELYKEN